MEGAERRSDYALNSLNFFLAQIASVIVPFLNVYLRQNRWRYDEIGLAMAAAGMGSLIFQVPAGFACDRSRSPKRMLIVSSLTLGTCYALVPYLTDHVFLILLLMFISGIAGTFFGPLLATFALSIAGRDRFHRVLGKNQSWSHAGNVGAGIAALFIVKSMGIAPLFYFSTLSAIAAAVSCASIPDKDLAQVAQDIPIDESVSRNKIMAFLLKAKILLMQKEVRIFLFCISLFHVANGPLGSMVSLYLKSLGSSDAQVAGMVLIAQPFMIPVSWLTGKYGSRFGRKPVFAIPFLLLPLRLLLYVFAHNPVTVLAITAIDGIVAGMFGVMVVLVCSDLTRENRGFNSLMGLVQTAPAIGAVVGVTLQGVIIQHLGFSITFATFAVLSLISAVVFLIQMPETLPREELRAVPA